MKKSISDIIHKINNHLASSNLSIEMLLKEMAGKLNSEQKKYLKNVLADGKKIKMLLRDISKISKG